MASNDAVIVGGGIAGMVSAYYLARAGVPSLVVERDAIGSHASGFASGGLSPSLIAWCWCSVAGTSVSEPLLARELPTRPPRWPPSSVWETAPQPVAVK
jgi:glycine/D-amino acid oxidase-like deaminating enzyme